jgi:ubiquinone/menaquinone biosynthesis C-methylase UbiE
VNIEAIEEPGAARAFDRVSSIPQFKLILRLVTAKALSNQRGGRAIDIGCGGGRLVISIAKRHPLMEVVGLDLSDEMINLANRRASQVGLSKRVKFRIGDAERVPFPDESFDLVVSTLSLHHWSKPERVFDEVARILIPGGKCALFDVRRDAVPFLVGIMWWAQHFIVPPALRRMGEPLGTIQSAYTREEASAKVAKSKLGRFCKVTKGPFWIAIKGRKPRR